MHPPEPFADSSVDPPVRGFLHHPDEPTGDGLVLAHGAGGNCRAALLIAIAEAFAGAGFAVLRCDLPFRQKRPFGPPGPADAKRDREGLKRAVEALQKFASSCIFLGGHSYGGRQATMLAAEEPDRASGLLLFSYPLHPPGRAEQLRTQHFASLRTPALFVHGTHDPFGSMEEMRSALQLIPAKTVLLPVNSAGHDLGFRGKSRREDLPPTVLAAFRKLFA